MKEVTAYRCDYCKKLYMRSGTIKKHRVWNEKLSFSIGRFVMLLTL